MKWVLCCDVLFTPAAKNISLWCSVFFCGNCVLLKKTILLTSMLPFREVPTTGPSGTMKVYPLTLSRHRADTGLQFYLASPKALAIASKPDFLSYTLFLIIFHGFSQKSPPSKRHERRSPSHETGTEAFPPSPHPTSAFSNIYGLLVMEIIKDIIFLLFIHSFRTTMDWGRQ